MSKNKKRPSAGGIAPDDDAPSVPATLPHYANFSVFELFDLGLADAKHKLFQDIEERRTTHAMGLVLVHAAWNPNCGEGDAYRTSELLSSWFEPACRGLRGTLFTASVEVCEETKEDEYDALIEGGCTKQGDGADNQKARIPPSELPFLALVGCVRHEDGTVTSKIRYLRNVSCSKLIQQLKASTNVQQDAVFESNPISIHKEVRKAVYEQEETLSFPAVIPTTIDTTSTIRIFVAGDKSSVGKSSICLGLLGSFLSMGYPPESLAYIKPATQSEATQLIQVYCEKHGIKCVPIGPLVYYRGFTRAFLAGEVPESTSELLQNCGDAVDRAARGKRIVLIDGVGFPAVGSICGTSNASVAKACGYPILKPADNSLSRRHLGVVLVGGSGVGAAVDSFNLNATFFRHNQVPVLGAVFNKLSLEGFYSLENCRQQVSRYFDQYQPDARPFGFVPLHPDIAKGTEAIDRVEGYIRLFQNHVDVSGIYDAAVRVKSSRVDGMDLGSVSVVKPAETRFNPASLPIHKKSRKDIEQSAIMAGAAPSA